jgi:hypothetical protein
LIGSLTTKKKRRQTTVSKQEFIQATGIQDTDLISKAYPTYLASKMKFALWWARNQGYYV